jgi:hypothetical protein
MHSFPSKLLAVFLFSFYLLCSDVCLSEEKHAPQIACYKIDVRLDTSQKKLRGEEIITFVNTSSGSVDTLFLHLYPNAFRSDSTILMRESSFPERIKGNEKYRGFMEVERVGLMGGQDLTDKKIIDETIMKLPLPHPLLPQQKIELEIKFMVKLPQLLVRMGYSGEDFMIGQWFPKMAVLEEDGSWNAHPYHFRSEFFADFGKYEISITVPPEYVIGATGHLADEHTNPDSTKTFLFQAEDVHDFAWAASPDYRISRSSADGIEVSFFYKPEHEYSVENIMHYAEFALEYYNSNFGKYHYDHFTLVDAKIGLGGGAMEYPTLITVSPSRIPQDKIRTDALIVFHEIAHQWWYGMVASNEFEEAWLDEGFAVFSEREALKEKFGKKSNIVDLWGIKLSDFEFNRLEILWDLQSDPIVKNSWEFRDYLSYRASVYARASLVLQTLANYLGEERMKEVLQSYFQRFKFKHPRTPDFIRVVNEVTGEDLTFFLEQLLYGTGVCDYGVTSIESIPIHSKDEEKRYETKIELNRSGEVILPVDVLIRLENGEEIKQVWDGKERWHRIEIKTDSKIKAAIIDPEDKIVLDVNLNNNSLTVEPSDAVMMKLSTQCLFWLEALIHYLTCF